MLAAVKFAKVKPEAKIPTKRLEDAGLDMYACFDDDYIIIEPHTTKLIPTGIPVSQKFVNVMDKMEARSKVGLKEDDKAFLLMSGSMGFGDIIKTAHSILDNGDEHWKVVAITGNNKDLYNSFEKEFKEDSRLILLGFTDMVSVYMSACDILLSKPGGLSSTEAFVAGIPIIHTSAFISHPMVFIGL